jgi:hypothetical protein
MATIREDIGTLDANLGFIAPSTLNAKLQEILDALNGTGGTSDSLEYIKQQIGYDTTGAGAMEGGNRLSLRLASLQSKIDSIETDVGGIQNDVGPMKIDLAAIKVDVDTIRGDVAAIKTDVATLGADLTNIKTTLNNILAAL